MIDGTLFSSKEILKFLNPILQLLKEQSIKLKDQIINQTIQMLEPEIYGVSFYSKDCNLVI